MKKVWEQPLIEKLLIQETAHHGYGPGFGCADEFSGPEGDGEFDYGHHGGGHHSGGHHNQQPGGGCEDPFAGRPRR